MSGPDPRESARLLRQRMEMGGGDVFLDGLDRAAALELLSRVGDRRPADGAAVPGREADGEAGRGSAAGSAGSPRKSAARTPASPAQPPTSPAPTSSSAAPKSPLPGPTIEQRPVPPLPDDYDGVRELALGCTACGLAAGRTQVVFSDGSPTARLMVVGEAPGAKEDESGVPFVGQAGRYLDLLLATVGLGRSDSVYIANVLKCRPPGNRDPLPAEIETCSPYLLKQIELVKPEVLLAVGSFSGRLLTGSEKSSLGKLRGKVHSYHGVPLVVTYHPAALLRNPNWTRAFWDDLQLLRSVIDGTAGE